MEPKLAYFDLKRAVHDQHLLFNPSVILIEDKASGTQLIQELIEAVFEPRLTRSAGVPARFRNSKAVGPSLGMTPDLNP